MFRLLTIYLFLLIISAPLRLLGQAKIELIDSSQVNCSFRGLSVVTDEVVWVSGSKGTVGRSVDGGKTWTWVKVPGFEKSDFRDIEAFDKNRAVIMASGTPAVILKTVDGGKTWKLVFKDERPEMFLDAMDFWDNKRGMMVGDPINGHFVLLETKDRGESWQLLDTSLCPMALDSEAVFAASGTSLRCLKYQKRFVFITGGSQCRLFTFTPCSQSRWNIVDSLRLSKGKPSQGGFSLAFDDNRFAMIVGGDYLSDTTINRTMISYDYVNESTIPRSKLIDDSLPQYRSSVEFLKGRKRYGGTQTIATGPGGTDWWTLNCCWDYSCWSDRRISNFGFNVVRKAKKGKAVFLAGSKGRIGKLIY